MFVSITNAGDLKIKWDKTERPPNRETAYPRGGIRIVAPR